MKKRIIALISLVTVMALAGCSSSSETIQSTTVVETVGSYSLFRTRDAQEYLSFLENFDEAKYEIVDISTSLTTGESYEFYIITYKTIK